jgi:uncharacterized protein (TIGR00290 family)
MPGLLPGDRRGLDVCLLLNMLDENGARSRSHGLPPGVLDMQAEAMGLPLVHGKASWQGYESEFTRLLLDLKEQGITDGIFGDIDMDEHRIWVEQVCCRCGITPHLPLWGEDQSALVREFIESGFKAVIVVTDAAVTGNEWLGREIDMKLISDLARHRNITPCGEAGEFHTLVTDGPLFSRGLKLAASGKYLKDGHWFLDIGSAEFLEKQGSITG